MFNRLVTSGSARSFAAACSDAVTARPLTKARFCKSSSTAVRQSTLRGLSTYGNTASPSVFCTSQRAFSSSHDDFSPQKKQDLSNEDDSSILKMIESHITSNRIMLYMKGNPSQPMCGFSATVVQILKNQGADFASVNVLDYPEVREGVKKYAQWPTIPQLYVDGEFVGGCDIIRDLDESGELADMLKGDGESDKKKD